MGNTNLCYMHWNVDWRFTMIDTDERWLASIIIFVVGLAIFGLGFLMGSEHGLLEGKVNACSVKGGIYLEDKCYKAEKLK
jgi:hypothetical protein